MAMQQVMTELVSKRKVDAALGGDRAVVDNAPLAISIRMRQQYSFELCGQIEALHFGDWGVGEDVARILCRDRCDLNGKPVESVRLVKYLTSFDRWIAHPCGVVGSSTLFSPGIDHLFDFLLVVGIKLVE